MIVMSSKYVTQQVLMQMSTRTTIKLNLNNEIYLKFRIKTDVLLPTSYRYLHR